MMHYKIKVEGKVQGVYFRAGTKEKAEELGLKGIVKNMPDGSVYIEAEGDPDDLEKLFRWCHEGTSPAQPVNVTKEPAAMKNYKDFSIEHS